jgi:ABC-type antimicrobial peptide transport system permease subunit
MTYRIVGVVASVKRQDLTDDDRPAFYTNCRQGAENPDHFVVRTAGDPASMLPTLRRAINEVSPQIVVTSMSTLDSRIELSVVEERFRATLSAIFGAAALVLASVGLYGLVARRVADRRREFGVRVALGARPGDLRRLVLGDALVIVTLGLAIGLPSAFATAQVTRSLLFGVSATAPHVFATAVGLLAVVVMVATMLPVRRAGTADPVAALRGS